MSGRLTTREHWERQWAGVTPKSLRFNPNRGPFKYFDRVLHETLPKGPLRFLEVGCFPGRMLAYFNQHFGYEVSGLEYVDRCARESQEMLDRDGISAEVIHDDLFEFVPESQWDVVGSFGFVEHFEDTQDTIEQHLKLLKPGGWLVLSIPNHSGVSGSVMRLIDRKLYASHNQMSADDLAAGAEQTGALEILTAGYYGHFSLCNAGIYRTARPLLPGPAFLGLRAGMAALDLAGRLLPDGRLLSVGAYLIARKRPV